MKKLLMSVITLSVAASAWGQTFESKEMPKNYDIIPKSLSYEGKSSIVIWSEDDENTVDVYDSNLEKVRSFTITPSVFQSKTITQKRKVEVIVNEGSYIIYNKDGDTLVYSLDWILNQEDIQPLENGNYKKPSYDYWEPNRFGETYPLSYTIFEPYQSEEYKNYYISYVVVFDYKENKTDEWETIEEENNTITIGMNNLGLFDYYRDYDNNVFHDGYYFTQTLFNTDEKIEYILPLYEDSESIVETQDEFGNDMRIVTSRAIKTGYKVVNEDGATLFTINDRNLDYPIIEKLGNKTYIVSYAYDHTTWYLIDQQSSSIESVKRIPTGKSQIYSVDGRKLNNTQRGINIIRKDDGSSTKQLIR